MVRHSFPFLPLRCAAAALSVAALLIVDACAPPLPPSASVAPVESSDKTKALTRSAQAPTYNLELVSGIPNPLSGARLAIHKTDILKIEGWAVDGSAHDQAGGVEVRVDGKPYQAQYGNNRPDVATAYHVPSYQKSGFILALPASQVGTGKHTLSIRVISHDSKSYFEGVTVSFEVT